GIRITRHQPQRLLLAHAADHDRRMRPLQALRRVQRTLQPKLLALERRLVLRPHAQADLKGFLKLLESLLQGWEWDAQAAALLLIPAGADAEPGPALREHVEGGHDLRQQARLPVMDAGHDRDQLRPAAEAGHEAERGVR